MRFKLRDKATFLRTYKLWLSRYTSRSKYSWVVTAERATKNSCFVTFWNRKCNKSQYTWTDNTFPSCRLCTSSLFYRTRKGRSSCSNWQDSKRTTCKSTIMSFKRWFIRSRCWGSNTGMWKRVRARSTTATTRSRRITSRYSSILIESRKYWNRKASRGRLKTPINLIDLMPLETKIGKFSTKGESHWMTLSLLTNKK